MNFNESNVSVVTITLNCNFKCDFCILQNKQNQIMSFDLFKQICNETNRPMILNGGEPFSHPDILQFIEHRLNQYQFIRIITNGTYLLKYMKDLKDLARLGDIQIKQSCNYELDRQYKGNLLNYIQKCSRLCEENKIHYRVNYIADKNSIKLEDLKELPIKKIHMTPLLNEKTWEMARFASTGRLYYEIDGTTNTNVIDNIEYLNKWKKG